MEENEIEKDEANSGIADKVNLSCEDEEEFFLNLTEKEWEDFLALV